jgi:hypothetical protein
LAEGQLLARRLFRQPDVAAPSALSYELIASAVFSDPQLATVGLTEAQARAHYPAVKVFKSRFRPLKHTLTGAAEFTLMKMLVDPVTDRVLGVHMAGTDVHEARAALTRKRLHARGVRVPETMSLICLFDDPYLARLTPALARYTCDPALFVRRLARQLIRLVHSGARPAPVAVVPEFIRGGTLGSRSSAAG